MNLLRAQVDRSGARPTRGTQTKAGITYVVASWRCARPVLTVYLRKLFADQPPTPHQALCALVAMDKGQVEDTRCTSRPSTGRSSYTRKDRILALTTTTYTPPSRPLRDYPLQPYLFNKQRQHSKPQASLPVPRTRTRTCSSIELFLRSQPTFSDVASTLGYCWQADFQDMTFSFSRASIWKMCREFSA